MYKAIQNQLKKTFVIGLPKFTIENMAKNSYQPASFSNENMSLKDHFFGSPMSNVFFSTNFELFHMQLQYKSEKVHGLFGLN